VAIPTEEIIGLTLPQNQILEEAITPILEEVLPKVVVVEVQGRIVLETEV